MRGHDSRGLGERTDVGGGADTDQETGRDSGGGGDVGDGGH